MLNEKLDQQLQHLHKVKQTYHKRNLDLTLKLDEMEENLQKESFQKENAKLDVNRLEYKKIKDVLVQVKKEEKDQKPQWKEERILSKLRHKTSCNSYRKESPPF